MIRRWLSSWVLRIIAAVLMLAALVVFLVWSGVWDSFVSGIETMFQDGPPRPRSP